MKKVLITSLSLLLLLTLSGCVSYHKFLFVDVANPSWTPEGHILYLHYFHRSEGFKRILPGEGLLQSNYNENDYSEEFSIRKVDGEGNNIAKLFTLSSKQAPKSSPDSTRIALNEDIVADNGTLLLDKDNAVYTFLAWSADSLKVLYSQKEGTGNNLVIYNLEDASEVLITHNSNATAWTFGQELLYINSDNSLFSYEPVTGEHTDLGYQFAPHQILKILKDPLDENSLYVYEKTNSATKGSLYKLENVENAYAKTVIATRDLRDLDISYDGQLFVFTDYHGDIYTMDRAGNETRIKADEYYSN